MLDLNMVLIRFEFVSIRFYFCIRLDQSRALDLNLFEFDLNSIRIGFEVDLSMVDIQFELDFNLIWVRAEFDFNLTGIGLEFDLYSI